MINKIVVHGGTFHADDVCSVSIARLMNPKVIFERVLSTDGLDVNSEDGTIVADIGFGFFDHHGNSVRPRRDGGPHSACTLLWERFGTEIIEKTCAIDCQTAKKVASKIEDTMLFPIADGDNGIFGSGFTINDIISRMNPDWEHTSEKESDDAFGIAVNFMDKILKITINKAIAEVKAEVIVLDAVQKMNNGIVILPCFLPWEDVCIKNKDARIVVFPSNRGGYSIQMVPVRKNSFQTRVDTPETWHGLSDDSAETVMPGMTFCHKNGFLASFRTQSDAIEAAKTIVGVG